MKPTRTSGYLPDCCHGLKSLTWVALQQLGQQQTWGLQDWESGESQDFYLIR